MIEMIKEKITIIIGVAITILIGYRLMLVMDQELTSYNQGRLLGTGIWIFVGIYLIYRGTKNINDAKNPQGTCCAKINNEWESKTDNFDLTDNPIKSVWVEQGCVVCNACEAACPEVFNVTDEDCLIINNDPDFLNQHNEKVIEASDGCCVEVIRVKFEKGQII